MNHFENVILMPGITRAHRPSTETDFAAALERARPAIIAACAPMKGLRAARRAQLLQQVFGQAPAKAI